MPNQLSVSEDDGGFRFGMDFRAPREAPADIAALNAELASFLESRAAGKTEINSLRTAVEELLTNLAKFGPPGMPGGATVRAEGEVVLAESEIRLTLSDNAAPFDPNNFPPPDVDADPLEREVGGLGLYMLFRMFREMRYQRRGDRNVSVWIMSRVAE